MLSFFVYVKIVLFILCHQYMRNLRKKPRNIGDSENVRKLQNVNISSNYETGISSIILDNVAPRLCFYHFLCKSNWNPVKIRPVYMHNNWICHLYCYFKKRPSIFLWKALLVSYILSSFSKTQSLNWCKLHNLTVGFSTIVINCLKLFSPV